MNSYIYIIYPEIVGHYDKGGSPAQYTVAQGTHSFALHHHLPAAAGAAVYSYPHSQLTLCATRSSRLRHREILVTTSVIQLAWR